MIGLGAHGWINIIKLDWVGIRDGHREVKVIVMAIIESSHLPLRDKQGERVGPDDWLSLPIRPTVQIRARAKRVSGEQREQKPHRNPTEVAHAQHTIDLPLFTRSLFEHLPPIYPPGKVISCHSVRAF